MAPSPYPQMVRIRNDGDSVFSARYAGQRYNLAPTAETFVPWEAMCLWFGHPFAVDVPGDKRKRYRTDELKRLYVKYGVYENHHERGHKFPKVSVWDISGDSEGNPKQYLTVCDDPEGENLNAAVITQADNAGLQAQIKAMQEQMVMMQAQLAASQNPNGVPTERTDEASNRPEIRNDEGLDNLPPEIPADSPTKPKAVARS